MKIYPDADCNASITAQDGSSVDVKSSQLWDLGLARFHNWLCSAGMTTIFVDHDLEVYGGQCRQVPLGNLRHSEFALNRSPTRCTRAVCTPCESDLYTAKWHAPD